VLQVLSFLANCDTWFACDYWEPAVGCAPFQLTCPVTVVVSWFYMQRVSSTHFHLYGERAPICNVFNATNRETLTIF
jgi:hypothetical protein